MNKSNGGHAGNAYAWWGLFRIIRHVIELGTV